MGALGGYISGSGSTLMGIWPRECRPDLTEVALPMKRLDVKATTVELSVVEFGAEKF